MSDAPETFFKQVKNRFGNIEMNIEADFNNGIFNKDIKLGGANNHYYFDYEQQAAHLDSITKIMKGEHEFRQPGDVESTKCHTHNQQSSSKTDEFMFAPAFTGQISEKNKKISLMETASKKLLSNLSMMKLDQLRLKSLPLWKSQELLLALISIFSVTLKSSTLRISSSTELTL